MPIPAPWIPYCRHRAMMSDAELEVASTMPRTIFGYALHPVTREPMTSFPLLPRTRRLCAARIRLGYELADMGMVSGPSDGDARRELELNPGWSVNHELER